MSLPSTATVTAWPWFVVAASGWACGGGADGGVIVSDTVPVADAPAASVTVYWKESVRSAWSIPADACTVAPSRRSCTAPSAGPVIVNVERVAGVGIGDERRQVDVGRDAGLDGERRVRGDRRAVARRQHVDRHRRRRRCGPAGRRRCRRTSPDRRTRRPGSNDTVSSPAPLETVVARAALLAVAAGEEQRVAVGVGRLRGEVDRDRLVGRRLTDVRLDDRRPVGHDEHGELGGVGEPGRIGDRVHVAARRLPGRERDDAAVALAERRVAGLDTQLGRVAVGIEVVGEEVDLDRLARASTDRPGRRRRSGRSARWP